jgi:hypothetical protein
MEKPWNDFHDFCESAFDKRFKDKQRPWKSAQDLSIGFTMSACALSAKGIENSFAQTGMHL